jgi:hypothetical protein
MRKYWNWPSVFCTSTMPLVRSSSPVLLPLKPLGSVGGAMPASTGTRLLWTKPMPVNWPVM